MAVSKETHLLAELGLGYRDLEDLVYSDPQTEEDFKAKVRMIAEEEMDDANYFSEKSSLFLSTIIDEAISKVDVDAAVGLATEKFRKEYPRNHRDFMKSEGWPTEWQNDSASRKRFTKKSETVSTTSKKVATESPAKPKAKKPAVKKKVDSTKKAPVKRTTSKTSSKSTMSKAPVKKATTKRPVTRLCK